MGIHIRKKWYRYQASYKIYVKEIKMDYFWNFVRILRVPVFIFLITIFTSGILSGQVAKKNALVCADKMVSYWSFDHDSTGFVIDQAGEKHDPLYGNYDYVPGISGKAMKLDGFRTYARRERMSTEEITDAFTVEAWIAPAAYPWSWSPIIDCSEHEIRGFFFGIDNLGHVGFKLAAGNYWYEAISEYSIPLREWTHLAAVYQADEKIVVYINGKERASEIIQGEYVPSRFGSATIGRNNMSQVWEEYQLTTPDTYFFLDGILDEICLSNIAKTEKQIKDNIDIVPEIKEPELSVRDKFPIGPVGSGSFGAYYTKLDYYSEWDDMWRVSDKPDIFVRFDNSPVQLIFWRGASFVPSWVSENGIWNINEWLETWGKDVQGCAEPIMDRHCRFSHVRLIESNGARVVIHWRYALNDSFYKIAAVSDDGRGEWCDEYHTIYPDMTGIRIQELHYSKPERRHDWLEQMILLPPGHYPHEVVENEEVTLVNMKGEYKNYSYQTVGSKMLLPEKANISMVNTKSEYKPYIIIPPDPIKSVEGSWDSPPFISYSARTGKGYHQEPAATVYGWWNHWPVAQIPGDGRWVITPDRASHFLLTAGVHWVDYEKDERTRTRIMLQGMTGNDATDLVPMAKSWLNAPEMAINTVGYTGGRYDRSEKAYIIEKIDLENAKNLEVSIMATTESPLINPAIIIKNWGMDLPGVKINNSPLSKGKKLRMGIRSTAQSNDLIIWCELESDERIKINFIRIS